MPEQELSEIMILLSVCAGFPSALNGTLALKEVLKERTSSDWPLSSYISAIAVWAIGRMPVLFVWIQN